MVIPKVKIKKILYATDLSASARYAFAYAISQANLYGAGLVILHVLSESPELDAKIIGYVSASQWEEIKRRHEREARTQLIGKRRGNPAIGEVLQRFCDDVRAADKNCSFTTDEIMVARGNPAEQIIAQALEKKCDLIVMGTHGHGRLAGAVMGSTALRVLRQASIPVLVVRLPEGE